MEILIPNWPGEEDTSFFNKFYINYIYWGTVSFNDIDSDILYSEGIIIDS